MFKEMRTIDRLAKMFGRDLDHATDFLGLNAGSTCPKSNKRD